MSASCTDCRTPRRLSWNETFFKSRKEGLGSLIWDRWREREARTVMRLPPSEGEEGKFGVAWRGARKGKPKVAWGLWLWAGLMAGLPPPR